MGRFSDDTVAMIAAQWFGGVAPTVPASWDVGLSSTQPTNGGANITEPAGGGYAEVTIANDTAHWAAPAYRQVANLVWVRFPAPSGPWLAGAAIGWFTLRDHATGLFRAWGRLQAAVVVLVSTDQPYFRPGTLIVNFP